MVEKRVATYIMKKKTFFSAIVQWLQSTEMFAQPSKQIPGRWQLYEYYTEPADGLVNVKEEQLERENKFWELEFSGEGNFSHKKNIPLQVLAGKDSWEWSLSRNFIIFIHPHDFRKNETFQFAIEKGDLKLLKKDVSGRIELFGFFRKLNKAV